VIFFLFFLFTFAIFVFVLYKVQYFFIFEPHKYTREPLDDRFTALEISTQDGTLLEGILYSPNEYRETLLYFGGRSQDSVALISKLAQNYNEYQIITCNYRAYGNSMGKLSEKDVLEDALFVARKLQEHYGKMNIMGYSLGSSVAAYVASKMEIKNLFLIGAFDSVFAIIKEKIPFLPSKMIAYRFDTASYVSKVKAKTYLLVSKDDNIVSFKRAEILKTRVKNLVEFKELSGYNHNEILFSPESLELVKKGLG
jgi:uncharacterized protein